MIIIFNTAFVSMWVFSAALSPCQGQNYTDMMRLMTDVLTGYDTRIRPIIQQSDPVLINVHVRLISLLELDVLNQRIQVMAKLILDWTDELHVWNPEKYNNISIISTNSDSIWMPSFRLSTSFNDPLQLIEINQAFPVMIRSNGRVQWSPDVKMQTSCTLDMFKFPRDEHQCSFQISQNSFPSSLVRFEKISINIQRYDEDGEWELVDHNIATYAAGPEETGKSVIDLDIRFKRRPTFFVINLLFPTCALSFLNILVFVLPVNCGEKVSYSITVLLSVVLFLGHTMSMLPPSSLTVPLVTIFLTFLVSICILSVVATIFTVLIHHAKEKEGNDNEGNGNDNDLNQENTEQQMKNERGLLCPCRRRARVIPVTDKYRDKLVSKGSDTSRSLTAFFSGKDPSLDMLNKVTINDHSKSSVGKEHVTIDNNKRHRMTSITQPQQTVFGNGTQDGLLHTIIYHHLCAVFFWFFLAVWTISTTTFLAVLFS